MGLTAAEVYMKLYRRSDGVLRAEVITGQVEPEKILASAFEYEGRFRKYLRAAGEFRRLHIVINSTGGMTDSAWGLLYALHSVKKPTQVLIDGSCGSAATIIACGIRAPVYITDSGRFFIHMPTREHLIKRKGIWTSVQRSVRKRDPRVFAAMYCGRTGKTREQVYAWMKKSTWFSAQEAVENGFCDGIMSREQFDKGEIYGKDQSVRNHERTEDQAESQAEQSS